MNFVAFVFDLIDFTFEAVRLSRGIGCFEFNFNLNTMSNNKSKKPLEQRNNSVGNPSNEEAKQLVKSCESMEHVKKIKYLLVMKLRIDIPFLPQK